MSPWNDEPVRIKTKQKKKNKQINQAATSDKQ